MDDPSVRIAAGEALALICEVGFLEKFVFDTNSADSGTNEKENDLLKQYSSMKELQEKISSHVRSHFQQTAKSSVCNSLNEQHKFSLNLLNVLEVLVFLYLVFKATDKQFSLVNCLYII